MSRASRKDRGTLLTPQRKTPRVLGQALRKGGTVAKVLIEFYMKRGRVDPSTVEDAADRRAIKEALRLVKRERFADAIVALKPLEFEWNWDNGDGDPHEVFTSADNVVFNLNRKNSTVKVGEWEGDLIISAAVFFELSLRKGVSRKTAQEWMIEKSMFFCGYIGRGWLYSEDDGGGVSVLAPKPRRRSAKAAGKASAGKNLRKGSGTVSRR